MRYLTLFAVFLFAFACNSQRTSQNDLVTIALQVGSEEKMEIRIAPDSELMPTKMNGHHALLLGQLQAPSHLHFQDQNLMMTTIAMQEAVSPESGFLNISPDQEGKWALVRGYLGGDVYEATIVCVFAEEPTQEDLKAYEEGHRDILKDCQ
jgi:hypothetical protein